jgi:hypothetical protein
MVLSGTPWFQFLAVICRLKINNYPKEKSKVLVRSWSTERTKYSGTSVHDVSHHEQIFRKKSLGVTVSRVTNMQAGNNSWR